MNTKLIITIVLASGLGVAAGWLAPHGLQANTAVSAPSVAAASIPAGDPPASTSVGAPTTANTNAASAEGKILYYICPMHPAIHYDHGGDCPICGMKLQPVYAGETNAPTVPSCCGGGCTR